MAPPSTVTTTWKCPALHVQFVLATGLVEKMGHCLHTAAPVVGENVLAAHWDGAVVAAGQNSPAGHDRQDPALVCPVLGLKVPAEQLVGVTDLTGQKLPLGQTVQSA